MNNTPPTKTPQRSADGQQRPVQGQQRPMQGQPQRPMQGQQRPPQPQQRPVQGQQRPMQGQPQRPMQGQPRPPQPQQRPMQGQQRPMQSQQRPMQNGQRPRPQGGVPAQPRKIMVKELLVIAVSILLIVGIVVGVAVMAFSGVFDDLGDIFDKNNSGYTEDESKKPSKPSNKPADTQNTELNIPTSLGLPVKTPSKNYVSTNAGTVKEIKGISSGAAILVDTNGNVTVAAKNADTRVHPASMAKLMTLIVACENITKANALLTVEQWMIDYMVREEGSGISYSAGQQISVEDALYLISYKSDTVACLLIAQYVAGSEESFVAMMNAKANDIGLRDTHFANTTGLYDDKTNGSNGVAKDYTYTTCRDMAAIMNCAINNSAVRTIITSYSGRHIKIYVNDRYSHTLAEPVFTRWFSIRFGDTPTIDGTTMKAIAGKTGGEDIPSSCFVTVAKDTKTNAQYICVTIGRIEQNDGVYISEATSTADTEYIYKNYAYNQ